MKKKYSPFVILSLLIIGAQVLTPKTAEAVLLVELASNHQPVVNLPEVVLCVILLPICLLDQNASTASSYSAQDLLDNGYNAVTIKNIETDQGEVMSTLLSKKQSLLIESTDTRGSVAQVLRNIDPQVSEDYINFITDINHLNE